jgi:hypothetical protein
MLLPLAALSLTVSAQQAEETATAGHWNYEGSLTLVNIDSERAAQELIKDRATAIALYANYLKSDWVTTLRGTFIIYSDENEFSQTVEIVGGFDDGDIETASSDANALSLGIATGRQWRFGEQDNNRVLLQLGYDHIFGSERSISDCTNCYSEDIEVDGGVFVRAAITRNFGGFSGGLTAAQYLTGDELENQIGVTFGSRF